ncbi:MAG TPA: hypothetical protein VFQ83_01450 [Candidatus Udaeobacter sp.]|jgi:hypothetical protein|nr:hypothetical protein [Candidatus Udaeobacter sp.]
MTTEQTTTAEYMQASIDAYRKQREQQFGGKLIEDDPSVIGKFGIDCLSTTLQERLLPPKIARLVKQINAETCCEDGAVIIKRRDGRYSLVWDEATYRDPKYASHPHHEYQRELPLTRRQAFAFMIAMNVVGREYDKEFAPELKELFEFLLPLPANIYGRRP